MTSENSTISNDRVLLEDVPSKLREARNVAKNVPYELHDLTDYMASVANPTLNPEGMAMHLSLALFDLDTGRCGFAKKVDFPEKLKDEKFQIIFYLRYFPLIIDKIASPEFAKEFRELFTELFGEAVPAVEFKEDFGVTIVEDSVVDISNKDKAEVLAALYNYSHPHGMGMLQYSPEAMTVEKAREELKRTEDFDYLYGRVMKISLEGTTIYTRGYNYENGDGAAEMVISQCHNV